MGWGERHALDLSPFDIRFTLLKKVGERVRIGEALAEDKALPERKFVSPASGTIEEVIRGEKRRVLFIVVRVEGEERVTHEGELIPRMLAAGFFAHIKKRPCDLLADPKKMPRSIFIRAIESAPFAPSPQMIAKGRDEDLASGLTALQALAPVHFVTREGEFENVDANRHIARGPHPIASPSIHIEAIDPISDRHDVVWTLSLQDVLGIGQLMREGTYDTRRVVGLGGAMDKRGFFEMHAGYPIGSLGHAGRLISGDPLMGIAQDYLGFDHNVTCAIEEAPVKREFLHFFRPGLRKFTHSKAYVSGFIRPKHPKFTTHQHGEERPFIDGSVYEKVMPLKVSTMHLIKALLAEDYEQAEAMGLLEVAPLDFALATFVCPSKIEMTEIVARGLKVYADQYLT